MVGKRDKEIAEANPILSDPDIGQSLNDWERRNAVVAALSDEHLAEVAKSQEVEQVVRDHAAAELGRRTGR